MSENLKILDSGMDNVTAYKLGRAGLELIRYPSEKIGDEIDRGLVLCRLLREAGFGIVRLQDIQEGEGRSSE